MLKELDVWSLRHRLSEAYHGKLAGCEKLYASDAVCVHWQVEGSRTCTPHFCARGRISWNDKKVVASAFRLFVVLSKIKDKWPENEKIISFNEPYMNTIKEREKGGSSQVVPITTSMKQGNYSIMAESESYKHLEYVLFITAAIGKN